MTSTTDPELRSFIPVRTDSHFPIQNLPYGVFCNKAGGKPRVGVAIGDHVLDLALLEERKLIEVPGNINERVFARTSLNCFMSLGRKACQEVREDISHLLQADVTTLRDDADLRHRAFLPLEQVELLMPVEIGDYTDFYSSCEHATNVGTMLRGAENALNPNWLHLPVAYHGRASSVVASGTNIHRPCGQRKAESSDTPVFGPSKAVDFELEMGFVVGTGNELGNPITTASALDHIFGMVIVNDWSARDIQKWEYQPLGPFLSKNFATSISPWVVTLDALEPFRASGPVQDPKPLPYLQSRENSTFDVHLQVALQTSQLKKKETICSSNMRYLYWNIAQQVAHHTITGCNLRTGDLLATGTISGPTPDSLGCLLEMTQGGKQPIILSDGESRGFLNDGDRVIMSAWCQGDGYRVGFGEVVGTVLPAGT